MGWLTGTRVRDVIGRLGTVMGEADAEPSDWPIVTWDDGTTTGCYPGAFLTRAPDDWYTRAVGD